MPRKRKTSTGTPAQPIEAVEGQGYGQGVQQTQMQRSMPTPDNTAVSAPAARTAPAAPTAGGASTFEDLIAAAQGVGPGGLLREPSQRPQEPVTAGLPIGPGPGPDVLPHHGAITPGGRFLRDLADRTGNPYFRELAERTGV
jgi:hypothetical protein